MSSTYSGLSHRLLRNAIGVAALAATVLSLNVASAEEAADKGRTTQELERRPIPGTDLEMRLNLVTQAPGYSEPLHHHPGPSFVYMLEGTAESAYGEEEVRRLHPGDHWSQPTDLPHRVARNPDPKVPRRFLVFTINHPGEPATVFP